MILLPSEVLAMKDAVSRAFSLENPDSGTMVLVGETGQEEMHEAREMDDRDGECGGGTGRGVNVTSICGSSGMKVEMV